MGQQSLYYGLRWYLEIVKGTSPFSACWFKEKVSEKNRGNVCGLLCRWAAASVVSGNVLLDLSK